MAELLLPEALGLLLGPELPQRVLWGPLFLLLEGVCGAGHTAYVGVAISPTEIHQGATTANWRGIQRVRKLAVAALYLVCKFCALLEAVVQSVPVTQAVVNVPEAVVLRQLVYWCCTTQHPILVYDVRACLELPGQVS